MTAGASCQAKNLITFPCSTISPPNISRSIRLDAPITEDSNFSNGLPSKCIVRGLGILVNTSTPSGSIIKSRKLLRFAASPMPKKPYSYRRTSQISPSPISLAAALKRYLVVNPIRIADDSGPLRIHQGPCASTRVREYHHQLAGNPIDIRTLHQLTNRPNSC
jgi:hypothetical protein